MRDNVTHRDVPVGYTVSTSNFQTKGETRTHVKPTFCKLRAQRTLKRLVKLDKELGISEVP
jgi:hypothetical protein